MAYEPLPFGSPGLGRSDQMENDTLQSFSQFSLALDRARDRHIGPGLFGDPVWEVIQALLSCDDGNLSMTLAQIAEIIQRSVQIIGRSVTILVKQNILLQSDSIPVTYQISEYGKGVLRAIFYEATSKISLSQNYLQSC